MSSADKTPFNLTQAQLSIWVSQKLHDDVPLHHVAHTFKIFGDIDKTIFEKAFQELVNTTEILRTVFSEADGIPYQSYEPPFTFDLEYLDLSANANEPEVRTWALQRAKRRFDLSQRTFDTALVKISNREYIWYLNLHHLITDGVTTTMIYARMSQLYSAILNGSQETFNSTGSYSDYVVFENEQRKRTIHQESRAYWKKKVSGLDELGNLYGTANASNETVSERISVPLGKQLTKQIKELAQHTDIRGWTEGSTLFTIFSTLFFIYIHRISGQQKLAIGSPTHNRTEKNFRKTPGIFIEVFPMVAEIFNDDTFLSVFRRIRMESNSFLKHAKPGILTPEIGRSFNVMLNYIMTRFNNFNGFAMKSEWLHTGHMNSAHRMQLHIADFDATGEIELIFDINASILSKADRNNFPKHFLKLLHAFLDDMNQSVKAKGLIDDVEFQKIISLGDKTDSSPRPIHESFEQQVVKTPKNIALTHENRLLTYEALNKGSNQMANYLLSQNVEEGSRVAILLKRTPEYVLSVLAVLKTGATFVPIPSNYPEERIHYLLKDSQAQLLISSDELISTLDLENIAMVSIDTLALHSEKMSDTNLPIEVAPNGIAYIIYTSGSTGNPKGVPISHQALYNHLSWAGGFYHVTESSVFPLFTSIGFDATLNAVFLPLLHGGKLMVYPEPTTGIDDSLFRVIDDNSCTFLKCTPSHLALLDDMDLKDCHIHTLIVGGEELKTHLVKSIEKNFGKTLRVFNQYGPTEAAIACIAKQYDPEVHNDDAVPIGKPIHNMDIYLLDSYKNPVPVGVIGELYICGIGVAEGYWNRPELTEEKFVPSPFNLGHNMYRTGDLARLNENGDFEYCGRTDFQVKLNGHRIELGEIENQIVRFETINRTVVLLTDRNGATSLSAYFTAFSKISLPELKNHLEGKLPNYMIPSHFKQVEEFPLSPSGKVDRIALKKWNTNVVNTTLAYTPPQNEIEELVVTIWQEVLEIPKIGIHDNFISLGGHSLAAIRVTTRINQEIEMKFPLNKVFEFPTTAEYAKYIEDTLISLMGEK